MISDSEFEALEAALSGAMVRVAYICNELTPYLYFGES